jgi:hypothetical protein
MFFSRNLTAILILFSFCTFAVKAQNNEPVKASSASVLVVPFQPSMYYTNNDQYICKASNLTPGELNLTIRSSVAASMLGNLSEKYNSNAISEKKGNKAGSDVEMLYSITRYLVEEKPLSAFYKKTSDKNKSNLFAAKHTENEPEYLNPAKPNLKKHKYYKAQITDTTKLALISANYKVNYILFIDNFEMETHFKDCIEMQKNISKRDLYVHYTLLSPKGKFLDGGVVCMTYESNSNDVKEIMKNTLPPISSMIMTEVKEVINTSALKY